MRLGRFDERIEQCPSDASSTCYVCDVDSNLGPTYAPGGELRLVATQGWSLVLHVLA